LFNAALATAILDFISRVHLASFVIMLPRRLTNSTFSGCFRQRYKSELCLPFQQSNSRLIYTNVREKKHLALVQCLMLNDVQEHKYTRMSVLVWKNQIFDLSWRNCMTPDSMNLCATCDEGGRLPLAVGPHL
jgi:hypothetical protein